MTKIKNTKKGMAKRTLSISLAVAMLATSNVPVWAAEFTDGADVAFTSEAPVEVEAPVVEEEVAVDAEKPDSIGADKLDVSGVTFTAKLDDKESDAEGKEVVFGSSLTIGGSVKKKTDGTALQDFSWGYRIKGSTAALVTGDTDATKVTAGDCSKMNQNIWGPVWNQAVGKTVELYIFRKDDAAEFNNVVLGEFKVVPRKVAGNVILKLDGKSAANDSIFKADGTDYTIAYTGKTYNYSADVTDENALHIEKLVRTDSNNAPITDLSQYKVTCSGTIQNAGDVMTIRVTPKDGSGLEGEFITNVTVVKRQGDKKASSHLKAELAESLTYEYTGTEIDIPNDKVVVKEIPGKYADATLQGVVLDVDTINAKDGIGNKTVTVALDKDAVKNFDISAKTTLSTVATEGYQVTITRRNLENVKVSLGYYNTNGVYQGPLDYVPDNLQAQYLYKYLVFTANDGTVLNLSNTKDYDFTIKKDGKTYKGTEVLKDQGVYTVTVDARENGNCVNNTEFKFEVGNAVSRAESDALNSANIYYNGTEIKPTKEEIGSVKIYGKVSGNDAITVVDTVATNAYEITGYKNNVNAGKATVTVKVTAGSYKDRTFDVPFRVLPLQISKATVTVPETVSIDKNFTKADEYKIPYIVKARNPKGTIVKGLSEKDFTVSSEFVDGNANGQKKNEIDDKIKATISSANSNYIVVDAEVEGKTASDNNNKLVLDKETTIVAKALTNDMVKVDPSSYTYTGASIVPSYYVIDGATVLYDQAEYGEYGEYKFVNFENNLNVGTGKVYVEGVNKKYSGKAFGTFEITPANTKDVKVEVKDQFYTGRQVRPRMEDVTVTLNGNDVTDEFELTGEFGENKTGKGTLVLKPIRTTKNFTGANVTAEFNIVKEIVSGKLHAYNSDGVDVTDRYTVENLSATNFTGSSFDFDGTAKTFAEVLLKDLEKVEGGLPGLEGTKATAADFEIKYADNVSGNSLGLKNDTTEDDFNIAYVYAVGKAGSGFAGNDTITLADGSKITGVVAKIPFAIKNVKFVEKNVTVTNGTYAGGLIVKPNVLVQINGHTLVEGKDYTLELKDEAAGNHFTDCTNNKKLFKVDVIGKGGYKGSKVENIAWGIDKKDLKDCDVKVVNGVAYVMNGYIPVPTTEYTVKENADKTYTVTANATSKNYTGSKTVVAEGQKPTDKPDAPMIQSVKVVGNKATVVLSGETEGATGYDYVISTDKDCITNKNYAKVNKNVLNTNSTFNYTQQGVYYAYCHAWKRGEDGKKIFSDWSNAYPFVVSAITPAQPVITSVKVKGNTVTVKYTKAANADGYDVVLGSKVATVAGERRPVEYGKLVKKNIKGNVVTATFKNVKKGTYYVGLHAFNRTSEDGKKVFSPWSNVVRRVVK